MPHFEATNLPGINGPHVFQELDHLPLELKFGSGIGGSCWVL
jgi:hypothetical protein